MNERAETILITGASRGIGAEAALALARPGRHLVLVARRPGPLQAQCEAVEARGATASAVPVDIADDCAWHDSIESILNTYGPLNGLILNAAMSNGLEFRQTTPDMLNRELKTNYLGPAELLMRTLPSMVQAGRGRIVVVGSLTSVVPFPGNASYSASKAALSALVRSLRFEYRNAGVSLGVVSPGYTATDMTKGSKSVLKAMSARAVGQSVMRCYEGSSSWVVPGVTNRFAHLLFSAFPTTSDWMLGRMARFVVPSPARPSDA